MHQLFFKTKKAFLKACKDHDAKLTTTYTGSGECMAGYAYSSLLLLVFSKCDYNNAPFFERGE